MPTLSMAQLPPPASWDEFEEIVWDLLAHEWDDPNTVRHGRQGQPQNGVDIYGRRKGRGLYIGAQCKLHSGSNRLTYREVVDEVEKAEEFEPPLGEFLIVTTARRDAGVQREVRLLSTDRENAGRFGVHVRFWEDVVARLALDLAIAQRHYPQIFVSPAGGHEQVVHSTVPTEPLKAVQSSFGSGKLQVFLSSRIHGGFDNERSEVADAVEGTGMAQAWYWERDGYANPEGYREVCILHAKSSDALVMLVDDEISAGMQLEFDAAKAAGRPCYVFIKEECQQGEQLRRSLDEAGVTGAMPNFRNLSELRSHVINALANETARSWRHRWGPGGGAAEKQLPRLERLS